MSVIRERARQVLRRIHESNVRLSFGPGMHVMTPDKFVFDAVLEALEDIAEAERRAALEEAAEVADEWEQPGIVGTREWLDQGNMLGEVAAAIRARIGEGNE